MLLELADNLLLALIQDFPGRAGYFLRRRYWRKRLKHSGNNLRIDCGVYLQNPKHISIGDNVWIDRGAIILAGPTAPTRATRQVGEPMPVHSGDVALGDNIHIGPGVILSGIDAGIVIGNSCTISAGCKLYAYSHHYRFDDRPWDSSCCYGSMVPDEFQSMVSGPIFLGENVGIAVNCLLLPGVTVERDSFILPFSVVRRGVYRRNSLLSGNPATRVSDRFTESPDGVG